MPFQKEVKMNAAPGIPGTPYSLNPEVVTVKLAGSGGVTVARFVWPGATSDEVLNTGAGAPLGFAVVTKTEPTLSLANEASMLVAAGGPVTIVAKGEYFAQASTAAVVDQKVFANLTDGSLQTAAAGATVAGAVETDWKVVTAAAAGEPFGMSNQR